MFASRFVMCFAFFSALGSALAFAADDQPQPQQPIGDKTLVVWVSPANLTQRGGSALTLEDLHNCFDGVVFGELAAGKWMAGSDLFNRTQREQENYPAETAADGTFVQLAIVYQGQEVTMYRNGKPYAKYTVKNPQYTFEAGSFVIIGRRHRNSADQARFAGAIDDARVYAQPLTAEQVASLKPNEASGPQPWAWWSFDESEAKERTGRFATTQLTGGAKVVDGKLVLDGKTGTLTSKTAAPTQFETPAMPANPPATWLTYHLAHPGPGTAMPGDPNCAFYWKGRYHLHYIYRHLDGFCFAHVSSSDMLHWKWHPTTLTPSVTEHGMFSGTGFYTKKGRPAIIYHGEGSGRNQIAIAADDNLERWTDIHPIEPKLRPDQDGGKISHWDPDCWLEGDTYYAIFGGNPGSGKPANLMKSPDLKNWEYVGLFLEKDMPEVQSDEDISCPNFFKLGDKRMLLCISHNKGCRYYLGSWKDEHFVPEFHARMNWAGWSFFAPESLVAADGRRVMWAWCMIGGPQKQSGIQSLPRELSLSPDGTLEIKPLTELATLRTDEKSATNIPVKAGGKQVLKEMAGDAREVALTIEPASTKQFGVEVHCDPEGNSGCPILVDTNNRTLSVAGIAMPFELKPGEDLSLRIFIDKSMIEVFANDRQAGVAEHQFAPENVGVSVFSQDGDVLVKKAQAWKIGSIYEAASAK